MNAALCMDSDCSSEVPEREAIDLEKEIATLRSNTERVTDTVLEHAKRLLRHAIKIGDENARNILEASIVRFLSQLDRFRECEEFAGQVIGRLRTLPDKNPLLVILNALGAKLMDEGRFVESIEHFQEAVDHAFQIERWDAVGHLYGNMGLNFTYIGDFNQALQCFSRSMEAWDKSDTKEGKANCYVNQGLVYHDFKDYGTARKCFHLALELYERVESTTGLATVHLNLAKCLVGEGKFDEALPEIETSLHFAESGEIWLKRAHALTLKGQVLNSIDRVRDARAALLEALKIYEKIEVPKGIVSVFEALAQLKDTGVDEAIDHLRSGLEIAERISLKPLLLTLHKALAGRLKEKREFEVALFHSEQTLELEQSILSDKAEQRARSLQAMMEVERERAAAKLERLRNVELSNALQKAEEMRQIAEEESRQKTRYLSIAAHDFRNLTGGLVSGFEVLRDSIDDVLKQGDRQIVDLLGSMEQNSLELHEMLIQVLEAGTLEDGQMKLSLSHTNLAKVIDEQVNRWVGRARTKGQNVLFNSSDSPVLPVDAFQIRRIVDNLLDNAIKYSPSGAQIVVSLIDCQGEVLIRIEDEGPGFTNDDMLLLGKPFQRLSAFPTDGEPSIGLGLYIVSRLVELHDGTFSVRNRQPKGACCEVRLPMLDSA